MQNQNNNYSSLHKFIFGEIVKNNLPVDNMLVNKFEDIANDYAIRRCYIKSVIQNAGTKFYKYNNFDYETFITYGLICAGKDRNNDEDAQTY